MLLWSKPEIRGSVLRIGSSSGKNGHFTELELQLSSFGLQQESRPLDFVGFKAMTSSRFWY